MSSMNFNFMEKLLDGVVVEWKALGDVVRTVTAPAKLKSEAYRATGKEGRPGFLKISQD